MYDFIIRNGTVYDGRSSEGRRADVAVEGERIAAVGDLAAAEAKETIDGTGLVVAPGFIDVHSHSEIALLLCPTADSKILQGVTTEITGNCGMSSAPLAGPCVDHLTEMWRSEYGIEPTWRTFAEYFDYIETFGGTAVNVASLAGHGNLRASVVGYSDKPASKDAIANMQRLMDDAMTDGALGISTGLIYPPGIYADTHELVEVSRAAARRGGIYTSHIRSENDLLMESVDEAIAIARNADIPVHISHVKASRKRNWHKFPMVLEAIEAARREGLDITCDCYPYTASWTGLDALLPAWTYDGGNEAELERLADSGARARIETELDEREADHEFWNRVMVSWTGGGSDIEGMTIHEIAVSRSVSPVVALMDILIEHRLLVTAMLFISSDENVSAALQFPHSTIGSDASVRSMTGRKGSDRPHPRAVGTFPRVLGKYVRDGVLSLGEAIYKMTGAAADRFGLAGRGMIEQGGYADLVLFDAAMICDLATYEDPMRPPAGIEKVWVNGALVADDGRVTGARPGRVLRHGDR
jgi:N-acyl-D-amino-acid deacylase